MLFSFLVYADWVFYLKCIFSIHILDILFSAEANFHNFFARPLKTKQQNETLMVHSCYTNGALTVHGWYTNGTLLAHELYNGKQLVYEWYTNGALMAH